MRELKPCPFCKSLEWFSDMPPHKDFTGYVRCNFCGAETPFDTWNNRPIEDGLHARIAELEAAHVVWLAEAGNEVNRLTARIAELEEKQRWIPVSERLPDTKIVYDKFDVIVELVDIGTGEMIRRVDLLSYDYRNKSWNDDCGEFGFYPITGVTHWRERPTLPKVQE